LRVVVAGTTAPSSTGTVSSFNGRTGAVTPGSSDYTAAQVGAVSTVSTAGGRNFLINGGMDIWQRGTSFPTFVSNTPQYTADRWSLLCGSSSQMSASQVSPNITTSSTTSQLTVVNATVTITVGTGLNIFAGNAVQIYNTASSSGMNGTVTSYNSSTGSLVSYINYYYGTVGTYSSWVVTIQQVPFKYALRVQRNSGVTSVGTQYALQPLETVNTLPLAGNTVTVSYWARGGANFSSGSSLLYPNLWTGIGTDQVPYNSGYPGLTDISTGGAIVLTTAWQKFSYTATINPAVTEVSVGWNYTPVGTAGANDYFDITGVQLEIGSTATAFSRAGGTIQGELAACQRYYVSFIGTGSSNISGFPSGVAYSTYWAMLSAQFPITMRVAPSTTWTAYGSTAITTPYVSSYTPTNDWSVNNVNTGGFVFVNNHFSGLTQGQPLYWQTGNILLSAEL